jgi:DNA-binding CsgD family transcriptional regulator
MAASGTALRFSPRQREIVALIAQGCSNVEIADELGISPRTVRGHSEALRLKLGVRRSRLPYAFRQATGEDPLELIQR